jgi:hypothetical protein
MVMCRKYWENSSSRASFAREASPRRTLLCRKTWIMEHHVNKIAIKQEEMHFLGQKMLLLVRSNIKEK